MFFVAQPNEITVLDTHLVKYTIVPSYIKLTNGGDHADGRSDLSTLENSADTLYYLANIEYTGKWLIYYNKSKKMKASEIDYFKKDDHVYSIGNTCYRDGTIKQISTLSENKDTSFTKEYYQNGKLKHERITVTNPDRTSSSFIKFDWYFDNGQILQTSINSTLTTPQPFERYYKTGQKSAEGTDLNGKWIGLYITYYKTGQKSAEGTYFKNWDLGGPYKEYYENGTIKTDCLYTLPKNPDEESQVIKSKHYYEDGKLKDISKRRGKKNRFKSCYQNGKLNNKMLYKNGNIKRAKTYYDNGKLWEKSRYRNGKEIKRKFYDGGQSGRGCTPRFE